MKRVLIAQRDDQIRNSMQRAFSKLPDVEQVCVCSKNEAVSALEREPFDVVVSGMDLFSGSGVQVLQIAKARCPSAKRVLFTGYADARVPDADAVFEKPSGAMDMIRFVSSHLSDLESVEFS